MPANSQETSDLVTFPRNFLNEKRHFLQFGMWYGMSTLPNQVKC